MKKLLKSGEYPFLALLSWSISSEGMNSSPVQRLYCRRTRTLLPTTNKLLKPKIATHIKKLTFSSTIPFFHSLSLPCGRILTMSPFSKSLRDFVLRSYYCFCLFFRSVISFFIWVAIFGLSNLFVERKKLTLNPIM
jgi:hypothetical protein